MPETILATASTSAISILAGSDSTDSTDAPKEVGGEQTPVVLSPEYQARIKAQAAIWATGWAEKASREAETKARAEVEAKAKAEQDVTRAAIATGELVICEEMAHPPWDPGTIKLELVHISQPHICEVAVEEMIR